MREKILITILLLNLILLPLAVAQSITSLGTTQISPTETIKICPAVECAISNCPYGCEVDESGCITGKCNPSTSICPAVACAISNCPYGCEVDESGCITGKCNPLTSTCPIGCTCTGETTTCPTEESKPTTTSVESTTGTSVVEIKKNEDKLEIKSGTFSATSKEVFVIKESKLYMQTSSGNTQIKVMPEQAVSSSMIEKVDNVELETSEEKAVYSISGSSSGKLLLVIPLKAEINVKINAETGEIISTEKPWWSFLAFGI